MAPIRRAVAVLAASLAVMLPASAQNTFRTGNWVGGSVFNGTAFSYCYVGVGYTSGAEIRLQLTPRLEMTLIGTNPTFNFELNSQHEFSIEFDGGYKRKFRGRASADRRNTISFALGNDPDLRRALSGNGVMTLVDAAGSSSRYNIANADNALRKLMACTALYGAD